jgi:hypothetical protein
MQSNNFRDFCDEMWRQNCSERRAYGESEQSYEDYILANLDFLFDKFEPLYD